MDRNVVKGISKGCWRVMRPYLLFLVLVVLVLAAEARKKSTKSAPSVSSLFGKEQGKKGKKGKSSVMVAIPRKKKRNGGGLVSGMSKFGGGLMARMAREMRTQFSSELEALTLQLTRPADVPIPAGSTREIVDFFNGEYDNPQLVVSVLAKLSRKLSEPSVYTKLKALMTVNNLLSNANSKGQMALAACMKSLQQETDSKVGLPFFSFDSVEQAKGQADSVGEIEMAELAREYATFLFSYIDVKAPSQAASGLPKKGRKVPKGEAAKNAANEAASKAEGLLEALELIAAVESIGAEIKSSKNKKSLAHQVLESVKTEKVWITKQLQKAHSSGALDSSWVSSVESALSELGIAFEPKDGTILERHEADASTVEAAEGEDDEIENLTKAIVGEEEEDIQEDGGRDYEDEEKDEEEDEEEDDYKDEEYDEEEEEDHRPTRGNNNSKGKGKGKGKSKSKSKSKSSKGRR